MEVQLQTVLDGAPEDTFVSMRIGDVQKQSRLSSSRTLRFPDPGEERNTYGRIEIFQRIGHVTVSFDSVDGEFQLVEVPCKFNGAKKDLGLRLAVKANAPPAPKVDKRGKVKQTLTQAQEYLEHHHLEEVLATAMREVIHIKPNDPHAFLSSHFVKNAKDGVQLPPHSKAKKPPTPPERQHSRSNLLPPLEDKSVPPLPLKSDTLKPVMGHRPVTTERFGEYYRMCFKSAPASAMARFHAAFPAPRRKTEQKDKPHTSLDEDTARQTVAEALVRTFADGSLKAALAAAQKAAAHMQEKLPYRQLPSVGSWLGRLPKDRGPQPPAPRGKPSPSQVSGTSSREQFMLEPSIGTWLSSRPKQDKPWYYQPLKEKVKVPELVEKMQDVIESKDRELERLKEKLKYLSSLPDPTPKALPKGFRAYYQEHIVVMPEVQGLYSNFKQLRPENEEDDTEVLRRRVSKVLFDAESSGRLSIAIGEKESEAAQTSIEALRERAAALLLNATVDGRLNDAFSSATKGNDQPQALRQQVASILTEASNDGRLAKALDKARSNPEATRRMAAAVLAKASADGSLAAALANQEDVNALRQQAVSVLAEACSDGRLAVALGGTSAGVEAARRRAASILLDACIDGRLEQALGERESQALRREAAVALAQASKDGRLIKSLAAGAQGDEGGSEIQKIRKTAAEVIMRAFQDGRLAATTDSEVEELRKTAAEVITRAFRQGNLKISEDASQSNIEALRKRAGDAIEKAFREGKLAMLRDVALTPRASAAHDTRQVEKLRRIVGDTIRQAFEEGRLVMGSTELDELRSLAADTLMEASVDGRLNTVLTSIDLDVLRRKASDALLVASEDGRLGKVLHELDTDDLRAQAAVAFRNACDDGRLLNVLNTLHAAKMEASIENGEETQARAGETLMNAFVEGRLFDALASVKGLPGPYVDGGEIEATRLSAASLLVDACLDGRLDEALASVRVSKARAQPFALQPSVGSWLRPLGQRRVLAQSLDERLFDAIDVNNDGVISKAEWLQANKALDVVEAEQRNTTPRTPLAAVAPTPASEVAQSPGDWANDEEARQQLLERSTSTLLKTMKGEEILNFFRTEVERRDKEISDLRRLLAQHVPGAAP